jgi:flagellar biosynthetic protein FlhB
VSEDRTFGPTPRRRLEARQHGKTARSAGLTSAVVLLIATLSAAWLGSNVVLSTAAWLRDGLTSAPTITSDPSRSIAMIRDALLTGLSLAAGLVLATFAASLAADVAQQGWLLAWPRITPDARRIDPSLGWERLLSGLHPLTLLGEATRWLLTCGLLIGFAVAQWPEIKRLMSDSPPRLIERSGDVLAVAGFRLAGAMLLLGLAHFGWTRWRHELALRMTWDELREEQRHSGGQRVPQPLRSVASATVTRDAG